MNMIIHLTNKVCLLFTVLRNLYTKFDIGALYLNQAPACNEKWK